MKVEDVKHITNKALEDLAASLDGGHSEALTSYLKTMALFSKYSLNNLFSSPGSARTLAAWLGIRLGGS